MMSSPDNSVFGSTQNGEEDNGGGEGVDHTTLSFSDSDFFLNLDDVELGPQIGVGAFSKVYLGRYLGELVREKIVSRCYGRVLMSSLHVAFKIVCALALPRETLPAFHVLG